MSVNSPLIAYGIVYFIYTNYRTNVLLAHIIFGIFAMIPLFFIKKDKFYKLSASMIFLILVLPFILHLAIFNESINPDAIQAVLSTNSAEAIEFIQTYIGGITRTIIFVLAAAVLTILFRNAKVYTYSKKKYLLLLLIPLFVFLVWKDQLRYSVFAEIRQTYHEYTFLNAYYDDLVKQMDFEAKVEFESISLEHNLLFIIGESASYTHMGCCGYIRSTNPFTEKLPFIILKAVTTNAHTISAIYSMLKVSKDSLPYILKKAGYYTYWISAQQEIGMHETPMAAVRNAVDTQIYIRTPGKDERVLPYAEEIFNNMDKPTAVFVHLEGSHSIYNKRYPNQYKYYNSSNDLSGSAKVHSQIVNEYDNSIRYTDSILYELALIAQKNNALFIYLPDHGEEVYDKDDFSGHSDTKISKYMAEVPFFILPPQNYNKDLSLYINRKEPVYITHTSYIIEDLLGVHPKGFSERRNPLSYFDINEIIVGGRKYADIAGEINGGKRYADIKE
jgi:heptose-I-phosphate ethanolaminephosphotransferase